MSIPENFFSFPSLDETPMSRRAQDLAVDRNFVNSPPERSLTNGENLVGNMQTRFGTSSDFTDVRTQSPAARNNTELVHSNGLVNRLISPRRSAKFLPKQVGHLFPFIYNLDDPDARITTSIPFGDFSFLLTFEEFSREEAQILADFNYVPLNEGIEDVVDDPEFSSIRFLESDSAFEWKKNCEASIWRKWVSTCIIMESSLPDEDINGGPTQGQRIFESFRIISAAEQAQRKDLQDSDIYRANLLSSGVSHEVFSQPSSEHTGKSMFHALKSMQAPTSKEELSGMLFSLYSNYVPAEMARNAIKFVIEAYSNIFLADEIFIKNASAHPISNDPKKRKLYELGEENIFKSFLTKIPTVQGLRNSGLTNNDDLLIESDREDPRRARAILEELVFNCPQTDRTPASLSYKLPIQGTYIKPIAIQKGYSDNGQDPLTEIEYHHLASIFDPGKVTTRLVEPTTSSLFLKNSLFLFRHIWSYIKDFTYEQITYQQENVQNSLNNVGSIVAFGFLEHRRGGDGFPESDLIRADMQGSNYARALKIRKILFNARAQSLFRDAPIVNSASSYSFESMISENPSDADDIQDAFLPQIKVTVGENPENTRNVIYCPYLVDDVKFVTNSGQEVRVVTARDLLKIKKRIGDILLSTSPDTEARTRNQENIVKDVHASDSAFTISIIDSFLRRLVPLERDFDPKGEPGSPMPIRQARANPTYSHGRLAKLNVLLTPENIVAHIGKRKLGKYLFDLSLNYEYYTTNHNRVSNYAPTANQGFAVKVYDSSSPGAATSAAGLRQIIEEDFRVGHGDGDPAIFTYLEQSEARLQANNGRYNSSGFNMLSETAGSINVAAGGDIPKEMLSLLNCSVLRTRFPGVSKAKIKFARKFYILLSTLGQIAGDFANMDRDGETNVRLPYFMAQKRKVKAQTSSNSEAFENVNQVNFGSNADLADLIFHDFIQRCNKLTGIDRVAYLQVLGDDAPGIPESLAALFRQNSIMSVAAPQNHDWKFSNLPVQEYLLIIEYVSSILVDDYLRSIIQQSFVIEQEMSQIPRNLNEIERVYRDTLAQAMTYILDGQVESLDNAGPETQANILSKLEKYFSNVSGGSINYFNVVKDYLFGAPQSSYRSATESNMEATETLNLRNFNGDVETRSLASSVYGIGAGGLLSGTGFAGVLIDPDNASRVNEDVHRELKTHILKLDRETNILVLFSEFICGQLFYGIDHPLGTTDNYDLFHSFSDYEPNSLGILNMLFNPTNDDLADEYENPAMDRSDTGEFVSSFLENPSHLPHKHLTEVILEYIEICDSIIETLPRVNFELKNTINDYHLGQHDDRDVRYATGNGEYGIDSAGANYTNEFGPNQNDLDLAIHAEQNALLTNPTQFGALSTIDQGSAFFDAGNNQERLEEHANAFNNYLQRANDYFRAASKVLSVQPTFRLSIVRNRAVGHDDSFSKINALGFLPHISIQTEYTQQLAREICEKFQTANSDYSAASDASRDVHQRPFIIGNSFYDRIGLEPAFDDHISPSPNNDSRNSAAGSLHHLSIPHGISLDEFVKTMYHDMENVLREAGNNARADRLNNNVFPAFDGRRITNIIPFYKNRVSTYKQAGIAAEAEYDEVSTFYGYPVNAFKKRDRQQVELGNGLRESTSGHGHASKSTLVTNDVQGLESARLRIQERDYDEGNLNHDKRFYDIDRITRRLINPNPRRRDFEPTAINQDFADFIAREIYLNDIAVIPPSWYAELHKKFPPIQEMELKKDLFLSIGGDGTANINPQLAVPNEGEILNSLGLSKDIKGIVTQGTEDTGLSTSSTYIEVKYRVRKIKYKFHRAHGAAPFFNTDKIGQSTHFVTFNPEPNRVRASTIGFMPDRFGPQVGPTSPVNGAYQLVEEEGSTTLQHYVSSRSKRAYWMPLYEKMGKNFAGEGLTQPNPPYVGFSKLRDLKINSIQVSNLKVRSKNFAYQMSKMSNLFQYMEKYQPTSTNQHSVGMKAFDNMFYDALTGGGRFHSTLTNVLTDAGAQRTTHWQSEFNETTEGNSNLELVFPHWSRDGFEAIRNPNNIFERISLLSKPVTEKQVDHLEIPNHREHAYGGRATGFIRSILAQSPATLLEYLRTPYNGSKKFLTHPGSDYSENVLYDAFGQKNVYTEGRRNYWADLDSPVYGYFNANQSRRFNSKTTMVYQPIRSPMFDQLEKDSAGRNQVSNTRKRYTQNQNATGTDLPRIAGDTSQPSEKNSSVIWLRHDPTKFEIFYAKAKALWLQNKPGIGNDYKPNSDWADFDHSFSDNMMEIPVLDEVFVRINSMAPPEHGKTGRLRVGYDTTDTEAKGNWDRGYRFYDYYLGQSSFDLFQNGFAYAAPYKLKAPHAFAPDSNVRDHLYHRNQKLGSLNSHSPEGDAFFPAPVRFGGNNTWCVHFPDDGARSVYGAHSKQRYSEYFSQPFHSSSPRTVAGHQLNLRQNFMYATNGGTIKYRIGDNGQDTTEMLDVNSNSVHLSHVGNKVRPILERVNYVEALNPVNDFYSDFDSDVTFGTQTNLFRHSVFQWDQNSGGKYHFRPGSNLNKRVEDHRIFQHVPYKDVRVTARDDDKITRRFFDYSPMRQLDLQHGDPTVVYDPVWYYPGDLWHTSYFTSKPLPRGKMLFNEDRFVHSPSYAFANKYEFLDFLDYDKNARVKTPGFAKNSVFSSNPFDFGRTTHLYSAGLQTNSVAEHNHGQGFTQDTVPFSYYSLNADGMNSGTLMANFSMIRQLTNKFETLMAADSVNHGETFDQAFGADLPRELQSRARALSGYEADFIMQKQDYGNPSLDPRQDLTNYWKESTDKQLYKSEDPEGVKYNVMQRAYYISSQLPLTHARSIFMTSNDSVSEENPYGEDDVDVDFFKYLPHHAGYTTPQENEAQIASFQESNNGTYYGYEPISYSPFSLKDSTWDSTQSASPEFALFNRSESFEELIDFGNEGTSINFPETQSIDGLPFDYNFLTDRDDRIFQVVRYHRTERIYLVYQGDQRDRLFTHWTKSEVPDTFDKLSPLEISTLRPLSELKEYTIDVNLKLNAEAYYALREENYGGSNPNDDRFISADNSHFVAGKPQDHHSVTRTSDYTGTGNAKHLTLNHALDRNFISKRTRNSNSKFGFNDVIYNNSIRDGGHIAMYKGSTDQTVLDSGNIRPTTVLGNPWRESERDISKCFDDVLSRESGSDDENIIEGTTFKVPLFFEAPIGKYLTEIFKREPEQIQESDTSLYSNYPEKPYPFHPSSDNSGMSQPAIGRDNLTHVNFSSDIDARVKAEKYYKALENTHYWLHEAHTENARVRRNLPLLGQVRFHEHEVMGMSYAKFHRDMAERVRNHNIVNARNARVTLTEMKTRINSYQHYARYVVAQDGIHEGALYFQPRFARNPRDANINSNSPHSTDFLFYQDANNASIDSADTSSGGHRTDRISSMHWVGGEWRTDWQKKEATFLFEDRHSPYTNDGYDIPLASYQINYSRMIAKGWESSTPGDVLNWTQDFGGGVISYAGDNSVTHRFHGVTQAQVNSPNTRAQAKTSFYPYNIPRHAVGPYSKKFKVPSGNATPELGADQLDPRAHGYFRPAIIKDNENTLVARYNYLIGGHYPHLEEPLYPLFGSQGDPLYTEEFAYHSSQAAIAGNHAQQYGQAYSFDKIQRVVDAGSARTVPGLSGRDYNDERTERMILTRTPIINSWYEEFPVVDMTCAIKTKTITRFPNVYYDLDYTEIANNSSGLRGVNYLEESYLEPKTIRSQVIKATTSLENKYVKILLSYKKYMQKFQASEYYMSKVYQKTLNKILELHSLTAENFELLPEHLKEYAISLPFFVNNGFTKITPHVLSNLAALHNVVTNNLELEHSHIKIKKTSFFKNEGGTPGLALPIPGQMSILPNVDHPKYYSAGNENSNYHSLYSFLDLEKQLYSAGFLKPNSRVCFVGVKSGELSRIFDAAKLSGDGDNPTETTGLTNYSNQPFVSVELEMIDPFRPWFVFKKIKKFIPLAYVTQIKTGELSNSLENNPETIRNMLKAIKLTNFPDRTNNNEEEFDFGFMMRDGGSLNFSDASLMNPSDPDGNPAGRINHMDAQTFLDDLSLLGLESNDLSGGLLVNVFTKMYARQVLGLEFNHTMVPKIDIRQFLPPQDDPKNVSDPTLGEKNYSQNIKYNTEYILRCLSPVPGGSDGRAADRRVRRKFLKYFFDRHELEGVTTSDGYPHYTEFDPQTSRYEVLETDDGQFSIFNNDLTNLTLEELRLFNSVYSNMMSENNDFLNQTYSTSTAIDDVKKAHFGNYLRIRSRGIFDSRKILRPFSFKEPINSVSLRAAEILSNLNQTYSSPTDYLEEYSHGFKFDFIFGISYRLEDFEIVSVRSKLDGMDFQSYSPDDRRIQNLIEDAAQAGGIKQLNNDERMLVSTLVPYLIVEEPEPPVVQGDRVKLKPSPNMVNPLTMRVRIVKTTTGDIG